MPITIEEVIQQIDVFIFDYVGLWLDPMGRTSKQNIQVGL